MASFSWHLDLAGVIQRCIFKQTKRNHFFNGIYKYQKRLIDLHSPFEIVKQVTSISIELGVEVEVTISDV